MKSPSSRQAADPYLVPAVLSDTPSWSSPNVILGSGGWLVDEELCGEVGFLERIVQNKRASQENVEFFISGAPAKKKKKKTLAELVGSAHIHEQMFSAVPLGG